MSVLGVGPGQGGSVDPDSGHGCDKVDFLFVVDNSGSMADEQQALIDSFPSSSTRSTSASAPRTTSA